MCASGAGAVRATQGETVALPCHVSVHMCARMCACLSEKRQHHFYCLPPLPLSSLYTHRRCRRLSVLRCYVIAYKPISQAEL